MFHSTARVMAIVGAVLLLFAVGCTGAEAPAPTDGPQFVADLPRDRVIILADIAPEEPTKKLKRFQPLADYLAKGLETLGIQGGGVVIARDIDEMARFLGEDAVDLYFDSPFPTLAVQELSGSQVILRRWKKGNPEYWSSYVALRGNGINSVDDLVGEVVAFEEPHSTSGFILPAGTLIDRGYELTEVGRPDAKVAPHQIGYFFSQDEKNTVELVLQGRVAAGGVSNEDYDELPAEFKDRIVIFDRTITVPRQLVSVRRGLDPGIVRRVRELLMGLDRTEEGRKILEGLKKTKKFDPLPPASEAPLKELKMLMKLVAE